MTRKNPPPEKRNRIAKYFKADDVQRAYVEGATAMGYRQRYIAEVIPGGPISVDTLQRHFRKELKLGAQNPISLTEDQLLLRKSLSGKGSRRTVAARIKWLTMFGSWKKEE
jgi:hypothetical protein